MNPTIAEIENRYKNTERPRDFQVGDTVDVHVKIREGEKERVQIFTGTVIRIRGGGENIRSTFTVRRIVAGEGVERVFPYHSRRIVKVEVKRPGRVRRAKLYYLRDRIGKATKVKERRIDRPKDDSSAAAKRKAKKKSKKKAVAKPAKKKSAAQKKAAKKKQQASKQKRN